MNRLKSIELKAIISGYIDAIEWTEYGPDSEFTEGAQFSGELIKKAESDCEAFYNLFKPCLSRAMVNSTEYTWKGVGHDLWLTRNGHGAGFWGRKLGSFGGYDIGDCLSEACKMSGESYLYEGDDGLLYLG